MVDLAKTGYLQPYGPTAEGLQGFYPDIWNLYQGGPPDPLSPQQQVAPLNQLQQQGIGQLAGYGAPGGAGAGYQDFLGGQLGAGLNMDEVMGYADNPFLDDQIQAALRDPYRQFTEQTMPGLDMMQGFTGNTGSSRGDLAEGVAARGYADRASDVAAQMRGAAYGQGLDTALNTRRQDQGMAGLANQIGLGNIDALLGGGQMGQQQEQRIRDAMQGNWQYGVESPWWQAENYSKLATPGAGQFGTQYGVAPADFMDILLGGLVGGGAGSLFGGLFGDPGDTSDGGLVGDLLGNIGL